MRDQFVGLLADHDGNGVPDESGPAPGSRAASAPTAHSTAPLHSTAPVAAGHSPIAPRAGMPRRAKLIAASIVIDVIVLGVVLWFVVR